MALPPITELLPVPTSVPEEFASKGRNLLCRICGKWLRRLSVNHLRKHGLQSKAEYKGLISYLTRKENVDKAQIPEDKVTHIASLILKGQPIPDDLITHLSVVQQEVARTLAMSLDVTKMRRLARLQKLMCGMEDVDNRLFDPNKVNQLSFRDLIMLAEYGSNETRGLAEDLKSTAPPGGPSSTGGINVYGNAAFVNGTNPLPTGIPEDPRARSALLSGAAKLLAAQNDGTIIEGNPESKRNGSLKNGSHD